MQWTAEEMDGIGCAVDAMVGWRMECDAMDGCGFVNFYVFWFVLHAGCELTPPDPSYQKFCDEKTGTNLHTEERNKRFSTPQLLNADVLSSSFCCVLFGAICHVLLFVSFSLAPNLSLPGLVLVRMYTFFGTLTLCSSPRVNRLSVCSSPLRRSSHNVIITHPHRP
jgi:hypothetical protein